MKAMFFTTEDENHGWYIVGNIFYKYHDFDKAIWAFENSLESRQDDDEALLASADCYTETDKPKRALKYLMMAAEINPKPEYFFNLGNACFDLKRYAKAIEYYEKISKKDTTLFKKT